MNAYDYTVLLVILGIMAFMPLWSLIDYVYRKLRTIVVWVSEHKIEEGVIIHQSALDRIKELESLTRQLQAGIDFRDQNRVKRERGGQLRFDVKSTYSRNGKKYIIPYNDECNLVFDDQLQCARFVSEDWWWVERNRGRVGKRKEPKFDYLFVHIDDFDERTDINILEYYPYTDRNKRKIIAEQFVPFRVEMVEG